MDIPNSDNLNPDSLIKITFKGKRFVEAADESDSEEENDDEVIPNVVPPEPNIPAGDNEEPLVNVPLAQEEPFDNLIQNEAI